MGGNVVRLNVPALGIATQNFKAARFRYRVEAAFDNGQTGSVRCWFQAKFDERHWLLGNVDTSALIEIVPPE